MPHRFGKGYRNVLYTHPESRAKRRQSIKESIWIRKSMGLPVGRASRLHNRDGSLTETGREVLKARKAGMSLRHIAVVFGLGKSTIWEHCRRYLR